MKFKPFKPYLLVLTALSASVTMAYPLQEELRNMVKMHPQMRAARKAVEASQGRSDAAYAGYYPRISIAADGGREIIKQNTADATDMNRRKGSLSIDQNLFNGGKTDVGVDVAKIEKGIQDLNQEALTQDMLFEAISAYLQVGRHQTLIELTKLNEQTTRKQLELESTRAEKGGGNQIDVMQAETRLQVVRERRVFYEQGLRDALATYEQIFSRTPDLAKIEDLEIFDDRLPKTLVSAVALGLEKNPRLRISSFQAQKAEKMIAIEESGYLPSVDLSGSFSRDRNANAIAARDEKSLLLKFNWNLFSGFETKNRSYAALKDHEELLEREQAAQSKTVENIRISWNQVVNGRERVVLIDNAVATSYDLLQNRKRLRDAGQETALNVLDAEVEFFGILANKVNAIYDTRIGSYRLLATLGELNPSTIGLDSDQFFLPVKPLSIVFD